MAIANDDNESQGDSVSQSYGPASPATERAILGSALERPLPGSAVANRAHLVSALRDQSIIGSEKSALASALSRQSTLGIGIVTADRASLAGSAVRPPSSY